MEVYLLVPVLCLVSSDKEGNDCTCNVRPHGTQVALLSSGSRIFPSSPLRSDVLLYSALQGGGEYTWLLASAKH
jgi:hypothetical protein